jgi:hypothetical protein
MQEVGGFAMMLLRLFVKYTRIWVICEGCKIAFLYFLLITQQAIQWTLDSADVLYTDMGVNFGGSYALVAKEFLDITHVSTSFQQMGGEGMPQRVNTKVRIKLVRTLSEQFAL